MNGNQPAVTARPGRFGSFLYLVAGLPLGFAGAAVLLAGWLVVALLAITPLVVPALVGFRAAVGGLAWLEAKLANRLLGTRLEPPTLSPAGTGFWSRAAGVARDETFWRQQVQLLQGFVLRGALAIGELVLLAAGVQAVLMPLLYRWSKPQIGSWHVDTLERALPFLPAGLAVLGLALWLLGPLGRLLRTLAGSLLRGAAAPLTGEAVRSRRKHALGVHAAASLGLVLLMIVVWASTTRAYFWPEWLILPLALLLAVHACVVAVLDHPEPVRSRGFTAGPAIAVGVAVLVWLFLVAVWGVTGLGYFWPGWALIAVALVVALAFLTRRSGGTRRIAVLESTRKGAVDQQDAELRRIERDLHDGAQARLVALGMSIGMAEQKLASDPAAAATLLAEARLGAKEALEELRDLARGIHPPVLADRGLEAAIAALAARSPLRIDLSVDLPGRPQAAVETAAYFVVAEALANAGKHASSDRVQIALRAGGAALVVTVTDDGVGGADPQGTGLLGLRRRVEALDGTVTVTSPAGGPTTITATIPW